MNRVIAVLGCIMFCAASYGGKYLSPLDLVADPGGTRIYVAESTANRIVAFDPSTNEVIAGVGVGAPPTGLALDSKGGLLYVTSGCPDGTVSIFDTTNGNVAGKIPAGHSPRSPVLSPDDKTLYVCDRFQNRVLRIDLETEEIVAQIETPREPFALALTSDGKVLLAANHLPAGAASEGYTSAIVSVIDTESGAVTASIPLPNGSTALRGICVSPDGKHAYATHILARYHLPATQLERGWMNTNALSVIDVEKQSLLNTFLLDNLDLGAANPWGVVCADFGRSLCVSHAGTHEMSLIDRTALHEKLENSETPETEIPNDLAFSVGIRERIQLQGYGPRGMAVAGGKVYIAEYFTDSLAVVDLKGKGKARVASVPLGPKVPETLEREGERLFNDATLCFQHWQSCETCHPDARVDALNWDLLNDGIGNPKNTKNMLLAHETPPTTITGIRKNAEMSVRAGFRHIQFAVRPESDSVAVDAYMRSLEPVPSPYLVDGEFSESARRGEAVFEKALCAGCHPAPLFTDMKRHDVGTGIGNEKEQLFDTPSLVEGWRTAPYLYDGRAVTMKDMLDGHKTSAKLSEEEIDDLIEYLLSI